LVELTYDYREMNGSTLLSFYAPELESYQGMQMELGFSEELQISQVMMHQLDLGSKDIRLMKEENKMRISHSSNEKIDISSEEPLFALKLEGMSETREKVVLSETWMSAEVYRDNEATRISLNQTGSSLDQITLLQNEPNPWTESTVIKFELPRNGEVSLRIFDSSGKLVWSELNEYDRGMNAVTIDKSDLPHSGVMIYEIRFEGQIERNRMIHLR